MADHAHADAHSRGLGIRRAAVDGVASLAGLAEGQIIKRLEHAHSRNCRFVALEADVGLDRGQHVGAALVARMAVQAGNLLFLPFEPDAHEKRVFVLGVDRHAVQKLLVEMTFTAEGILLRLGHLFRQDTRIDCRIAGMRRQACMAGPALPEVLNGDDRHMCLAGVPGLLPGIIFALMTRPANHCLRYGIGGLECIDGGELPGPRAS